jgi:hypothetical protein
MHSYYLIGKEVCYLRHHLFSFAFLVLITLGDAFSQDWTSYPYRKEKKIIEFGWDLPSAQFVSKNISSMELRPFDGLIFSSGSKIPHIFSPVDWSIRPDIVDSVSLQSIQWKKFTDNFLIIWSGDHDSMSYFNDALWNKIISNMRLIAKAARLSRCRGINFDTEFYSKRSPWDLTSHAEGHSQQEVQNKVRKRGRDVMEAWQSEFPDIVVLCQFVFMYVPERWDLLPYFMNGMLEAAGPEVRIIEGDEESYYWGTTNKWFDRYHEIKVGSRNKWCDSALYAKYDRQIQVGKSLYDAEVIKDDHSIDEKSKRWEHNVYMGLMTTDEYVWGYFEEVNWWNTTPSDQPMGNTVADPPPAWIENGISQAYSKYKNLSPPGWDMKGEIWSDGTIDSTLSVKIISPRQGDSFTTKQSIPVVAEIVNAGDTAVCQVDFYINMIKIGRVSQAPWSFQSGNLPPGAYDIVVRAHAGIKITGTSAPIRISVKPVNN